MSFTGQQYHADPQRLIDRNDEKHALSYDSPLYGRRTAQIRLMPLPFTAVYAAQSLPFDQAVQQYALTGGVPKYLEFFTEQEPLIDQIRSIVLSKMASI